VFFLSQPEANNTASAKKGINWAPLIKEEDWLAVWIGAILILGVIFGIVGKAAKFSTWDTLGEAFPAEIWGALLVLLLVVGILNTIAASFLGEKVSQYVPAFIVVFLLTTLAQLLGSFSTFKAYSLEVALWALVVGLLVSNTVKTPAWMKPAIKAEMYIKTGLVLLGCEILFNRIVALGLPGMFVAWVVTPIVLIAMYFFGVKVLGLNKEFALTLSAATSVCGVSAAIATGAACKAKQEHISIAITISLLFTVLMIVAMPALVIALGIPLDVGAALIGGTIDSTGAVPAAGALLGDRGVEIASVVKMIQNVLIGVIAFVVAIIWTAMGYGTGATAGAKEIWIRFPKFILGFVGASLLFSFLLVPTMGAEAVDGLVSITKSYRGWFFALGFVCIGLGANFKELAAQISGGKPLIQYIVGQTFNIILTLIAAWLAFGGILFPPLP